MNSTQGIQGAIATVLATVKAIGPATARSIEQHPDVVAACRSSKTKARRLIDRLQRMGQIQSDGAAQMPRFQVKD